MKTKTVEKLAWILIYGGLVAAVLGTALRQAMPAPGILLTAVGAFVAVAGALLIGVRATMKNNAKDKPTDEETP